MARGSHRFARADDWTTIVQAMVLVPFAIAGLTCGRLESTARLLRKLPLGTVRTAPERTARLAHTVTRHLTSCLPGAAVLQALLIRSGERAELVIGVSRDGSRLSAHAWVEVEGRVLSIDGAAGFEPLHRFDGRTHLRAPAA